MQIPGKRHVLILAIALCGCQLVFPLEASDDSAATDAGGSGDAGSGDAVADTGPVVRQGIACGDAGFCNIEDVACCEQASSRSCMNGTACVDVGGTEIFCAEQADCPGQSFALTWTRCCGRTGNYATQCYVPYDSGTGCPAGLDVMCNPANGNSECPSGLTCKPFPPLPGYFACQ